MGFIGRTIFLPTQLLSPFNRCPLPLTSQLAKPATHENTGFCHLGQAYNARKGSTYTHAATVAASL